MKRVRVAVLVRAAVSTVSKQLEAIKNEIGPNEKALKALIVEGAFKREYISKIYYIDKPREIPDSVKRQYPDVCFAIQALSKHMGGDSYFKKWEELNKFLSFKEAGPSRVFYHFIPTTLEAIENLRDKGSIKKEDLKLFKSNKEVDTDKYASWTYNSVLFRKLPSGPYMMTLQLEELLKTQGRTPVLVVKKAFKPYFNVAYFTVHMLNAVKRVFGEIPKGFGTLKHYINELEVIGPPVDSVITKSMVHGYYLQSSFVSDIDANLIKVTAPNPRKKGARSPEYEITPSMIQEMKKQAASGSVSYSIDNSLIIVSDVNNRIYKTYVHEWEHNEPLSKAVGTKLYVGYWR